MLDPEKIEDTVRTVNEAMRDNTQVNRIVNTRAGGSTPLIAQAIADRFRKQNQKRLL
jgi:hypothetical protein